MEIQPPKNYLTIMKIRKEVEVSSEEEEKVTVWTLFL